MDEIKQKEKLFLMSFICLGILLRIIWPMDMEWKFDEQWMFNHALEMANSGSWGLLGMESGGNMKNPGLSVWIFTSMAYFVKTPIGMLKIIQWINVITILLWILLIYKNKSKLSSSWIWAITLFSVSPLPILFSRKIWAQDIIPIFTFFIFLGFLYRKRFFGALIWGLVGGLIGQIHMSGFFFSFGIMIVALIKDLKFGNKEVKWGAWLLGSFLSLIPMLPWINYILTKESQGSGVSSISNIFKFRFLTYNFMDVTGTNIKYSLGKNFYDFIKLGFGLAAHSYLNAIIFAALSLIAFVFGVVLLKKLKNIPSIVQKTLKSNCSFNLFCLCIFLGFGIVISFTGLKIRPHYLIILYPFSFYIFIVVLKEYKKILFTSVVLQFLLSLNFLIYVHKVGDVSKGDYGKTYRMHTLEANK